MRSPRLTRVASCLLGVFVCIELVYLPLSNAIQRVPRRMAPLPDELLTRFDREGRVTDVEPVQSTIDVTGTACDRWGQLTAQGQGWSLFAPRFGENGAFVTLHVTATDGTTTELRSRFEPADPDDFVRLDLTNHRLFNREGSYAIVYAMWTPDSFAARGEDWRRAIAETVTTFRRSLSAYVRWRLREEYTGPAVREVAVAVRVFLPPSNGTRPPPLAIPVAKWVPDRPDQLVPFDPVTGTFPVPPS
ncbi:MAG TPA: hypothetical protein VKD90_09480 [Gemmataceae bacterium]|nr:hypothetical protein [Gemmataceae bacterium]